MSAAVLLVGDASTGLKTIELTEGKNVIGRGEKSGVSDKKCSRSQVTATLTSTDKSVFVSVSVSGINPSSYQPKGSSELQAKPKGSTFPIHDGDTLFLAGKSYPFVLKITGDDKDNDMEDEFLLAASNEILNNIYNNDDDILSNNNNNNKDDNTINEENTHISSESIKSEKHRLGFASLGTSMLNFDPKRAAAIACEEIKEFLESNRDTRISIVLAEPDRRVFEEFQASRPADERFVLTEFNLAALSDEGLPCRFVACETNWRWKPADPEMDRMLASRSFNEKHRKLHSDVGKTAQVYETAVGDTVFFACVVPNGGNPLKADYIENRSHAEDELRKTYKTLLNKFNDHIK